MIKTKHLIGGIEDVPSIWVFEKYLKINMRLCGQDVMVRSIFNSRDKRPSMSLYVSTRSKVNQYKFYDHSTGKRGDKIDLVRELEGLSFGEACDKIVEEYNKYILNGNVVTGQLKQQAKYKITECIRRKWNILDRDYWTQYEIGSDALKRFQIWSIDHYQMSNGEKDLIISGEGIYGYFTASGELYKLYQPLVEERRFMRIMEYVQGWDQLKRQSDTCIITKALKDVVVLDNLKFESVAPSSESTFIPEREMADLIKDYKYLYMLFDNDRAGIEGMKKYEEKYGIPGLNLSMEKDPSDSVKKHGGKKVLTVLNEKIKWIKDSLSE